jgi:hypothetical protein
VAADDRLTTEQLTALEAGDSATIVFVRPRRVAGTVVRIAHRRVDQCLEEHRPRWTPHVASRGLHGWEAAPTGYRNEIPTVRPRRSTSTPRVPIRPT